MDSYIIQIKSQDELTLVIDKMVNTQAQRIYLLIPENSLIAQHALNFRLLKREADALGKEVIVVSASSRVQMLALKSSIKVHQETERLKKGAKDDAMSGGEAENLHRVDDIMPPVFSSSESTEVEKSEGRAGKGILGEVRIPSLFSRKSGRIESSNVDESSEFAEDNSKIANKPSVSRKLFLPKSEDEKFLPIKPDKSKLYKSEYTEIREKDLKIKGLVDRKYQLVSDKGSLSRPRIVKIFLAIIVVFSVGAAAFTFYSVLPSAKVYIKPTSENFELDFDVVGDISATVLDKDNFKMPAQIFEETSELSKNFQSSGEREIRDKARGKINAYNAYSSESQTLVKTTRFVSEDGKLFRTAETVVVPGANVEGGQIIPNFISVDVVAAEVGEEYNIGPSSFSIPGLKGTPKYLAFYGKSEQAMTGGRIAKVKVITESDYNDAIPDLKKELENKALGAINNLVPEGFVVPGEAYEIGDISIGSDYKIGDEGESFAISGKVSTRAFAFRKSDLDNLISHDFSKEFSAMKLAGGGGSITFVIDSKDFGSGTIDLKVSSKQRGVALIDPDDVRNQILGKEEVEFRRILSVYPGIEDARVTLWPFWVSSMPKDPNRINITLE